MPTDSAGSIARRVHTQQIDFLRFAIRYNDAGIATGRIAHPNPIPQGALVLGSFLTVQTAFNAATTNVLSVGTEASTYTNLITTAQAVAGTPGAKGPFNPTGACAIPLAADSQVFSLYTQTGAAASAGLAYAVVTFVPDIDAVK